MRLRVRTALTHMPTALERRRSQRSQAKGSARAPSLGASWIHRMLRVVPCRRQAIAPRRHASSCLIRPSCKLALTP